MPRLEAFPKLAHGDAVGVLSTAPGPREAARLSISQIRSALRRGGRQRSIERRAAEIREALRSPQLEAPPAVSKAFAASTRSAVALIAEINRQIKELETELTSHFEQHPDAEIYRFMPGLGVVLGARVLGEFGDDPERYDSAKSRRNYAATSPLTVASGRKRTVGCDSLNWERQANWCLGRRWKSSAAKEQAIPCRSASRARVTARWPVKRR